MLNAPQAANAVGCSIQQVDATHIVGESVFRERKNLDHKFKRLDANNLVRRSQKEFWMVAHQNNIKYVIAGESTVGKNPSCTIVLEGQTVSKLHARLTVTDSKLYVQDRGSTNGTSVNGVKIDGVTECKADSVIHFGQEEFVLR